jgi:hypothetical protein
MKASLFFVAGLAVAVLSIAPANAAPKYPSTTYATTTGDCSTTGWPRFSAIQCAHRFANSYVECATYVIQHGATHSDAWWWCTSQGYKN